MRAYSRAGVHVELSTVAQRLPFYDAAHARDGPRLCRSSWPNRPETGLVVPIRAQVLRRPDSKERVGFEDLSVAAENFQRLPHYREAHSAEGALEYWTSPAVLPFGLVKLTSTSPGAAAHFYGAAAPGRRREARASKTAAFVRCRYYEEAGCGRFRPRTEEKRENVLAKTHTRNAVSVFACARGNSP